MFWFEMLMYQNRDRYLIRKFINKANNKLITVQLLLIYLTISNQSNKALWVYYRSFVCYYYFPRNWKRLNGYYFYGQQFYEATCLTYLTTMIGSLGKIFDLDASSNDWLQATHYIKIPIEGISALNC